MTNSALRSIVSAVLIAALVLGVSGCATHQSAVRTRQVGAGLLATSALLSLGGLTRSLDCRWSDEPSPAFGGCETAGRSAFMASIPFALAGVGVFSASFVEVDRFDYEAAQRDARWDDEELEVQVITLTALRSEIGVRVDTTCARFKRHCDAPRACLLEYNDAACIDADARMTGHPELESWWQQLRQLSWSTYALEQELRTYAWVRGAQVQSIRDAAE